MVGAKSAVTYSLVQESNSRIFLVELSVPHQHTVSSHWSLSLHFTTFWREQCSFQCHFLRFLSLSISAVSWRGRFSAVTGQTQKLAENCSYFFQVSSCVRFVSQLTIVSSMMARTHMSSQGKNPKPRIPFFGSVNYQRSACFFQRLFFFSSRSLSLQNL